MLQVIFGDDEHTAADGPYNRVLKSRKWLYILSVALIVLGRGLYNEERTTEVLKVVSLPASVLGPAIAIGISYLLFQYVLLVAQLLSTYDIVLNERLRFRRYDELEAAARRVEQSKVSVAEAKDRFSDAVSKAVQATRTQMIDQIESQAIKNVDAQRRLEQRIEAGSVSSTAHHELMRDHTRLAKLRYDFKSFEKSPTETILRSGSIDESEVRSAQAQLGEAINTLHLLEKQVPSDRRGYRKIETTIDLARVALPVVFATAGLLTYFL